jgi:hypothetical protein
MKQNDSCKIEVPVPPDANLDQIQEAVVDALRSSFTDLTHCRNTDAQAITINIKFKMPEAAT